MGLTQSIKAIISYSDIQDISKAILKQVNYNFDKMERGEKKDDIAIEILEEKYWRDRKAIIQYNNKKQVIANRRKREIQELKKDIKIFEGAY